MLRTQLQNNKSNLQVRDALFFDELILLTETTEKKAIARASLVLAMTQEEADQISSKYPGKRIEVNPTGSDMPAIPVISQKNRESNFLFFGSSHPPNIEAAIFIKDLARKNSDLNFIIAGSVSSHLQEIPVNLKLMGEISDQELTELINKSFAFVNPIMSGSGVSLKSLRVLASGLPMISTQLGMRGIEVEDGNQVIIATIDDFEFELHKLKSDETHWNSLRTNSLNFAMTYLDWSPISKRFANLVIGDSFDASIFRYIPVANFREHGCLNWMPLNVPSTSNLALLSHETLTALEGFANSSKWNQVIKPKLRNKTPDALKRIIKKFI